jgi:hypothetical protein
VERDTSDREEDNDNEVAEMMGAFSRDMEGIKRISMPKTITTQWIAQSWVTSLQVRFLVSAATGRRNAKVLVLPTVLLRGQAPVWIGNLTCNT